MGASWWPMQAFRELDEALLHLEAAWRESADDQEARLAMADS